jgi:predicted anti-sigma-YlaC factor YlaD
MNCPHENETLAGRALEEHLAQCASCREVAIVSTAIAADFRAAERAAHVPTSGLVWWRIQRRERQEAMQTASRAVTVVQAISIAVGVVIALGLAAAYKWLDRLPEVLPRELMSAATLAQWSTPLALGVVACLMLAPVALYFAVAHD